MCWDSYSGAQSISKPRFATSQCYNRRSVDDWSIPHRMLGPVGLTKMQIHLLMIGNHASEINQVQERIGTGSERVDRSVIGGLCIYVHQRGSAHRSGHYRNRWGKRFCGVQEPKFTRACKFRACSVRVRLTPGYLQIPVRLMSKRFGVEKSEPFGVFLF